MDLYDITIIGGGPTGLFGSFYAGLRGLKVKVIDVLPELGGQLTALYPEKYVYDVAGHPKILAKDLAKNLATQASLFKPTIVLGEKVLDLKKGEDGNWQIVTDQADNHYSKTVLLALGAGACVPKKLDADYPRELEGECIFYAVKNKERFRGKNVLIIGGGDSAVDWANEFSVLANKVTLIHRRDGFRAVQTSVEEMKRNKVDVKTFYELKEIKTTDKSVEEAIIFDNRTGKEETLKVDAIVINIGFVINLDFLKSWGLKMDVNAISVNEMMETSLPGVYAAGDIAAHTAKLKLIATGAAEAATAVNFAVTFINPSAKAFPGHSSNLNLSI
ncbi:MAG TPA: NAD(P)/FAD-dependent oxidoreductase [Candidatus Obscuribacter sp.]|nr:NAD(P)/FAD-dependent oxidoreductase [Candidatus Melainabacteria bacterium]MBK8220201.1 NAD(P)/FAD-dependent oxidoreductase [Candidatus Obscuribacter sp.]MBK9281013.1 NAD(P)/FAD-dependent oxidoreductase [Candidatus Obscuribacter sp.]MBL8085244.1 NAD(P)/FAD-dependent oxidoreductase [Candidatus Obscuribacter sp.]MDX1987732.1 NAD(P)/FAD-dependent oxidoreductase [Candidatus Obscuribacter sp.]